MKTKKKLFRIAASIFVSGMIASCQSPDVGFFSYEGIRMQEDTLEIVRGVYEVSAIPFLDGSTRPMTFEFVSVTDLASGEVAREFFETYSLKLWSEPYDGLLDTTLELVNEKLIDTMMVPLLINSRSGQLAFNSTTMNVPSGLYGVDVEGSNSAGSKVFENYAIVDLVLEPFERPGNFGDYLKGINVSDGKEVTIKDFNPYSAADHSLIEKNEHPFRSLYKVGDSDIVELELVLKDAYGTTMPPQALTPWYDAKEKKNFNRYHDNSVAQTSSGDRVEYTDTSCIFRFPTVPYPAFGSMYNDGDNIYLTYYNIDNDYWTLTPEYQDIANQVGNLSMHLARFKNSYKINEPGRWLMTVKSRYIKYNGNQ